MKKKEIISNMGLSRVSGQYTLNLTTKEFWTLHESVSQVQKFLIIREIERIIRPTNFYLSPLIQVI